MSLKGMRSLVGIREKVSLWKFDACFVLTRHPEIILLIPQAASDSIQRVTLEPDTPFEDALSLIYETIPCSDVARKPTLSYNGARPTTVLSLQTSPISLHDRRTRCTM